MPRNETVYRKDGPCESKEFSKLLKLLYNIKI